MTLIIREKLHPEFRSVWRILLKNWLQFSLTLITRLLFLGCKMAVYLATGTAVIMEPDKGSSVTAKDLLDSLVESEELALSPYAAEVFSIWMASSFLGNYPSEMHAFLRCIKNLHFLHANLQKSNSNQINNPSEWGRIGSGYCTIIALQRIWKRRLTTQEYAYGAPFI